MKKYLIIILLFSLSIGHAENYTTDYIAIIDQLFHMEYTKARMDVYKNDVLMKYYEMDCYRKDHKVRMDFTGPAVEKGRRMLDDESNIWMYMPRTSKIMKLPLKQSFMGSDASNRDVFRLKFGHEYDLVNTTPADQKITILELKAKDQSVAYSKVLIWFDEENRVPLKQEMYTLSGKKIKTVTYSENKIMDGRLIPTVMIIVDELQKNTYTRLEYYTIQFSNNKPAEFFTLGGLKR